MKRKSAKSAARKKVRSLPRIAFVVDEPRWREDAAALRLMRRAARLALGTGGHSLEKIKNCTVTVLLTGDERVRALNRDFRGHDRATNVLSFLAPQTPTGEPYLGDIAMAFGVVKKESRMQKKTFAAHAAHLAAHGVLHLLGHDHEKKREATVMEGLEILLLERLGLPDPYRLAPYTKGAVPA